MPKKEGMALGLCSMFTASFRRLRARLEAWSCYPHARQLPPPPTRHVPAQPPAGELSGARDDSGEGARCTRTHRSNTTLRWPLNPALTLSPRSPSTHPFQGINTNGLRFRLVDATDQVVGRLAARIATVLQGKDKPTYRPNSEEGDVVVVVNASAATFTGRKWTDKTYKWHTGFPGGLKERSVAATAAVDPTEPLKRAVYGMLPKNRLRDARARKLRVFAGPDHPFAGDPRLVPWEPPPRKLRVKEDTVVLPDGFVPLNPARFERRFFGGGKKVET